MSNHSVYVVPVELAPHGNADSLSIVHIGGFTCVVRTADWQGVTKAGYCSPDTLVPVDRPEFAFLAGKEYIDGPFKGLVRIRAMRLRGVWSEGLLFKVRDQDIVGDDVTEAFGCGWYEPPEDGSAYGKGMSSDAESTEGYVGKLKVYDVENVKKSMSLFTPREPVIATEKLHGSNGRWRWDAENQRFWCGSKSFWRKDVPGCAWWDGLRNHPEIQEFLQMNPQLIVFGELLGTQKGFPYHPTPGYRHIAVFDIFDTGRNCWFDTRQVVDICDSAKIPYAPVVYEGPFDLEKVMSLIEGKSKFAPDHALCMEGVVVRASKDREEIAIGRLRPNAERIDFHPGRVIAKLVSRKYTEKS